MARALPARPDYLGDVPSGNEDVAREGLVRDAGQIAQAVVQDTTATVSEAWTSPKWRGRWHGAARDRSAARRF